jgi:tryptophan synthase alpha chain
LNRIDNTFRKLRDRDESAFIPFLTAGDPDLETTGDLILAAEGAGADLIELGFPFSYPIADGPTIQASYTRVLERGQKTGEVFDLVGSVRQKSQIPIVAMISYSLVYRMGVGNFLDRCAECGIDGATIPDLPVEEMQRLQPEAQRRDQHLICFVTPATPRRRRSRILSLARGFIYYIAVRGITGARQALPPDLSENLKELKSLTDVPVAVGFGISEPEHARAVASEADGVIVGSAIVERIHRAHENGESPATVARDFIEDMAAVTRNAQRG